MVDASHRLLERSAAAALIQKARTTVLCNAGVADPPQSAGDWAFVRLYDALAENLEVSGRPNVTVSYAQLAVLASQRGQGKAVTGASLRKPFSQNLWRGALLQEPVEESGIRLQIDLEPAAKRGRPLVLRASFRSGRDHVEIRDADPEGPQPIVEEVQRALATQDRHRRQVSIAGRLIEELREAGFEKSAELSRWLGRRGLRIPPAIILAILIAAAVAAVSGAAYALYQYVVAADLFQLKGGDVDGELHSPPPPNGELMVVDDSGKRRFEIRYLPPHEMVATVTLQGLRFRRSYPDTTFRFRWTLTSEGKRTVLPEVGPEARFEGHHGHGPAPTIEYHIDEVFQYGTEVVTDARRPLAVVRDGDVVARGDRILDTGIGRGWRAGLVTVLPLAGYAKSRKAPIEGVGIGPGHVRFVIRHGPVDAAEHSQLRVSFGDGAVWSSGDEQWRWRDDADGDWWDRYTTVVEHTYSRSGRYDVRFTLRHLDANDRWAARYAAGSVYVGVPVPAEAPTGPRQPLGPIMIDAAAKPGTTFITVGRAVSPPAVGNGLLHLKKSPVSPEILPQLAVTPAGADSYLCVITVVPWLPPGVRDEDLRVVISESGVGPDVDLKAHRFGDVNATIFNTVLEYFRSGRYPVVVAVYRDGDTQPLYTTTSEIEIRPDDVPRVVHDGLAAVGAAGYHRSEPAGISVK